MRTAFRMTLVAAMGSVALAPAHRVSSQAPGSDCYVCIGFIFQCPTQQEMDQQCRENCFDSQFNEGTCVEPSQMPPNTCLEPGEYAIQCSLG